MTLILLAVSVALHVAGIPHNIRLRNLAHPKEQL